MPAATKSTNVDLSRLNQTQAAWLIGESPSWLRERAHKLPRNEDGTYHAARLFEATKTQVGPCELSDELLEAAEQLVAHLAADLNHRAGALRILGAITDQHGNAGLAVFARILIAEIQLNLDAYGAGVPTAEKIQDEAEKRIRELDRTRAENDYRTVWKCESCGRFKWGRSWKKGPLPDGYVSMRDECPACESIRRKKETTPRAVPQPES